MTDVEPTYEDFIACQRYGRRNAILENSVNDVPGALEAADLPKRMTQLQINESGDGGEVSEDCPTKEKEKQAEGS